MKKTLVLLPILTIAISHLQAEDFALPESVKKAPANTYVKITEGMIGNRNICPLYSDELKRFFLLGLFYDHRKLEKDSPHTEMTLNPETLVWENYFPEDDTASWGGLTGPAKKRHAVLPKPVYCWRMNSFYNFAYDRDRKKIIATFCVPQTAPQNRFFLEYDIAARTWARIPGTEKLSPAFWEDVAMGSICYDPVNKSVLGVQGRWELKDGKWSELKLGSERINQLREKSRQIWRPARHLVGACRARYYVAESPEEEKNKLDLLCGDILKKAEAYLPEIKSAASSTSDTYEQQQIAWAQESLRKAIESLSGLKDSLKGAITKEMIWETEDARDALNQISVDLAAAPPKRGFSQMACDEKNGKIVMFGGHTFSEALSDTWVYDCATKRWFQKRPDLSPSPRRAHSLLYLRKSGKILLVDGCGYKGYRIGQSPGESWVYDVKANTWNLLKEGGPRPNLTGHRHYERRIGLVAPGPNDSVLAITFFCKKPTRRDPPQTWMALIDADAIDSEGTKTRGVPFGTRSTGRSKYGPRWHDNRAGDMGAAVKEREAWFQSLKANEWKKNAKVENNPRHNRSYGKFIYDPARQQILHWGGGHVANTANVVLQYSLRSNRYFVGHLPEYPLNWPSIGPYGKIASYTGRPFMAGHARCDYDHDPVLKKAVIRPGTYYEGKYARVFFLDPYKGDWDENFSVTPANFTKTYFRGTPFGHYVWANTLYRMDHKALTWEKAPAATNVPRCGGLYRDTGFDEKNKLVILFHPNGDTVEYNIETKEVRAYKAASPVKTHYKRVAWMPEQGMFFAGSRFKDETGQWRWILYDSTNKKWLGIVLGGEAPLKEKQDTHNSFSVAFDAPRSIVWASGARAQFSACKLDLKNGDVKELSKMIEQNGGKRK